MRRYLILLVVFGLLVGLAAPALANSAPKDPTTFDQMVTERIRYWRSQGYELVSSAVKTVSLYRPDPDGPLVPVPEGDVSIQYISPSAITIGAFAYRRIGTGRPVDWVFEGDWNWGSNVDTSGTYDFPGLSWNGNLAIYGENSMVYWSNGTYSSPNSTSQVAGQGMAWTLPYNIVYPSTLVYPRSGYVQTKAYQMFEVGAAGNLVFSFGHAYQSVSYSLSLSGGGMSWSITPSTGTWTISTWTTFQY
ncbi:MAG TPA: hypothetical protein VGL40_07860 [Bacillota bacterium]